MSLPRQLLPGATYLVTRRCSHRQFLLRPSAELNQIVLYCLAVAAQRTGILLHAVCVMSNHWHLVLTDPGARLPRCMAWAHSYIARCANALYGRTENFWDPRECSIVLLEHPDDVLDKIVYTLTNPVQAELVPHARDWPGLQTADLAFGADPLEVARPAIYFRTDGAAPATAALTLTRPPQFADLSDAAFTQRVQECIAQVEHDTQIRLQTTGRRFRGAAHCRQLAPTDRPATEEPRRDISPRVAARDAKLRQAMLARRRTFLTAYRAAFERWRHGERDVEFPPGTYWLRIHHHVRCAAVT